LKEAEARSRKKMPTCKRSAVFFECAKKSQCESGENRQKSKNHDKPVPRDPQAS
jgi:hypothetical protein